nr:hypothetical protein [Tanacetum cinerariifolium]
MSSDNAQYAVTYASISSDSDGPSWGIPLMNASEFLEMDPYEEVSQQGQALIDALAAGSSPFLLPPTSPACNQTPLGHRTAMIIWCPRSFAVAAARAPRSQYDFVDTVEAGHGLDDASQISGGGLKKPDQPARVCSYTDFIKCQPLNFKGTEGVVGLSQWLEKMEPVFHISGCTIDNQVKFATCTLLGAVLTWWNGHNLRVKGNDVAAYTQRFQELALMCTKFIADETEKVDKYISGLLDNIHRNVMSARPKTLELTNDLMDQKLRTYAERQNENKRKTDNNQQQQPHKKQNVARAYTAGPEEKKVYTGDLPLCTKCNYHHTWQCEPKCGKCMMYSHTTTDCRANTNNNNNNKNQKAGACYECGNTGHIMRNCPKLNNRGNGVAQGRAYVLGGRDVIRLFSTYINTQN